MAEIKLGLTHIESKTLEDEPCVWLSDNPLHLDSAKFRNQHIYIFPLEFYKSVPFFLLPRIKKFLQNHSLDVSVNDLLSSK